MERLNILLIGSGARESALTWKLRKSQVLKELFVYSENPWIRAQGIAFEENTALDFGDLVKKSQKMNINLVICGPETPLADGLADEFAKVGIPTFGPVAAAARLEASKAFAKAIMNSAAIPTASYQVAKSRKDCELMAEALFKEKGSVVLKASGLASGKGVVVCHSKQELHGGIELLYTNMAAAATELVVEEFLIGRECSFFVFLGPGGEHQLGFAVDYKRAFANDLGPNTGGMGCYTPVNWLPDDAAEQVMAKVVRPLKEELAKQGIQYCGCLYVGLMWHPEKGPQVVEFNVRLGDPEAQVLSVADPHDWLLEMAKVCGFASTQTSVKESFLPTVGVVLASEGYPYKPEAPMGVQLNGDMLGDMGEDCVAFPASIVSDGKTFKPSKGRVLTIVARASNLDSARQRAYATVEKYQKIWPNVMYRSDIAKF